MKEKNVKKAKFVINVEKILANVKEKNVAKVVEKIKRFKKHAILTQVDLQNS